MELRLHVYSVYYRTIGTIQPDSIWVPCTVQGGTIKIQAIRFIHVYITNEIEPVRIDSNLRASVNGLLDVRMVY